LKAFGEDIEATVDDEDDAASVHELYEKAKAQSTVQTD